MTFDELASTVDKWERARRDEEFAERDLALWNRLAVDYLVENIPFDKLQAAAPELTFHIEQIKTYVKLAEKAQESLAARSKEVERLCDLLRGGKSENPDEN